MTTTLARPAAIYVRISKDREGSQHGVQRQRDDCVQLASERGLPVSTEDYSDNDISAYSGKKRPGYERLLGDVEAGKVGAILIWHTDRLHRSPIELEHYIDVVGPRNVPTYPVKGSELDLATPSGRMVARMLGATARYESEHRSERIARQNQQAAENGVWRGGRRPFGYMADGAHLHPTESKLVRQAYSEVIAGESLSSIFTRWTENGIASSTGHKWTYTTFRQMLQRARNYGCSVYRGEVVARDVFPAIVDEATWRKANAILASPGRRTSSSNQGKHLMSGLALCGVCDLPMVATSVQIPGKPNRTSYKCSAAKPHVYRHSAPIDEWITSRVLDRLGSDDAESVLIPDPANPDQDDTDRAKVDRLRALLAEAPDLLADELLTIAEFRDLRTRVGAQLRDLEARMASTQIPEITRLLEAKDMVQEWQTMTWRQRRTVVRALMTVKLLPVGKGRARTFHPDTVLVDWE